MRLYEPKQSSILYLLCLNQKLSYRSKRTQKTGFKMTTNYAQQASDFLNSTSTGFAVKFKEYGYPSWDKDKLHDIFTVTLANKLHRYRFTFTQSINESTGTGTKPPTAYDVLSCLQKYEVGTFDDFCGDFGYDTDSRTAYKTYKAVLKEWKNIELLFTPEQIELLQEIN